MPMTRAERDALLVRYRDGAAHFEAAMADVAGDELDVRAIVGEWTIREIAHHLADGELNSAVRLRRLIAEDNPVLPGYDEVTFVRRLHVTERPIATSVAAAAAARASTLTILETLSEEEWARTGTHTEQGAYSVEAWLRDYANHPWDHADQARRVVAALRGGAG
ncbi:MAG TPA: DinB family protein [Candidatus Limnocylindrales bacterium]